MLHHTFPLPSLLPGDGCMAVSCFSVPHVRSGIPPGLQFTPVHMVVHPIVGHPNQEGDIYCCARTTELMAESVYAGDIQSIVTDH